MIVGLATHMCFVADMDRSLGFYRDVLGLKPEYTSPYWSSFQLGNGRIGLHPFNPDQEKGGEPGWIVGFEVIDVFAFRKYLEDNLVVMKSDLHQTPSGVIFDFEDPDGNRLQAWQKGSKLK